MASTLTKGEVDNSANLQINSVFPDPVVPFKRMFFGIISLANSSLTPNHLILFQKAIANYHLALFYPTTN